MSRLDPVVHLELHTNDLARACAFLARLFSWRTETIHVGTASYVAVELGPGVEGGIVERDLARPLWLPYVAVRDITAATDRARLLGAAVLLEPREGPAGWRSVIAPPGCAELALWQQKASRR